MGESWKKKGGEDFQQRALREIATLREAVLLLGVVMLLFLLISYFLFKWLSLSLPLGINSRFAAVMVVELSSVGLPLAVFLRLKGFNIGRALGLNYSGTAPLAGAVLMGAATVLVIPQFEAWQARVIQAPEGYLEALAEFISLKQGESVVWALVCLALVPALCEEALFRGILLKACLDRWSKPLTIVGIGMVFGLFHLDLWRWPLLSVVGMLLTWTAAEAASLWPPIVFHLVNNSVSLLLANCSWSVEQDWVATTGDVPPGLFALGAGMLVLGAGLIGRNRGRNRLNNER